MRGAREWYVQRARSRRGNRCGNVSWRTKVTWEWLLWRGLRHRWIAGLDALEWELLESASESAHGSQVASWLSCLVQAAVNTCLTEHGLHVQALKHAVVLIKISLLLEAFWSPRSNWTWFRPRSTQSSWSSCEGTRLGSEIGSCCEAVGHAKASHSLSILQDLSQILLLLLEEKLLRNHA